MKKLEMKYSGKVTGFGEVMLRLTCPEYKRIYQCTSLDMCFGGAEFNVISSLSRFGIPSKYCTIISNNPFGEKILMDLRVNCVDISSVILSEGRLGQYFLEQGYGTRGSNVIYDRKYSCFSIAKEEDFNCEDILKDTSMLHISGITPALSEALRSFTLKLVKSAKENGILVSYDSNYRSKLWCLEEASCFTKEVLKYVDVAFLGVLDMKNILKYPISSEGKQFTEVLEAGYKMLFKEFPQLKLAACTNRIVPSVNSNCLQGFIFDGEALHHSQTYKFDVLDRVGGGDAFAAGILYKAIKGEGSDETVEFATAASVLKHSVKGDINLMSEREIEDFINSGLQNIVR